ncbi:hypothetical protein [Actinosynnema sp. NPDC020468]|uniref:hypothetical protein n=1 Tax=Actinosynnema sp. NPDC020468 TaxID=3154488 RepID=UPI0033CA262C
MSEVPDRRIVEEATAAASLTIDLVNLEASAEVSVAEKHTGSLLLLTSAVAMLAATVLGVPLSVVTMAGAGLSEWLITTVAVLETAALVTILLRLYRFRTEFDNRTA